ncbi:hypothetical protein [Microbacterium resistens]|uniref:hypothetical protein n=1 Tax=Microbacterium resistens TaxID=156977 RepID=UPI0008308F26|nr:hypothetical protein [Microbacterium resistens]
MTSAPARSRRGRLVAIALTLLVLVGGGALWWSVSRPPASAADTALAVFRAIADGDADAVRAFGGEVDERAADALEAARERPSAPRVLTASERGDEARVRVSFTLDGREHETDARLERRDGTWRLTDAPVGGLLVSRLWGGARIGTTPLGEADDPVALLPGVYDVASAPASLVSGEARAVVLPGEEAAVSLRPRLTEEGVASARAQLEDYLTGCTQTASAGSPPEHCGIRVPWAADLSTLDRLSFRIERMPALELDPPSFSATGGVLVATAEGTDRAGSAASVTYRTDAWNVYGDVRVDAEVIRLAVR